MAQYYRDPWLFCGKRGPWGVAKDIKKRWQEYIEEFYNKVLNDPDNHNSVVTHLELDILECEIKWALGSTTKKKVPGDDGITPELFNIL